MTFVEWVLVALLFVSGFKAAYEFGKYHGHNQGVAQERDACRKRARGM